MKGPETLRAILLGTLVAMLSIPALAAQDGPTEDDPYQTMNRKVFAFDMGLDRKLIHPASKGWDKISNLPVRESVDRFFVNLRFPRRFVSNLLQGEFRSGGEELGRFLINTTVGILGLFDPATKLGLRLTEADFGQAFGAWGIGSGPYLVLPFFGPSNPRDTVGLIFDSAVSFSMLVPVGFLLTPVDVVNYRSLQAQNIADAQAASLDYYVFLRNAYSQQRYSLIHHQKLPAGSVAPGPQGDTLYDLDYEDD